MVKKVIFIIVLAIGSIAYSQQGDCKVIKPEISASYTGGCKNGLAQGKGVAKGIDSYEGQFNKGLPSGKGKYTWADGTYYDGHWEDGYRQGAGKMVYKDSTVVGYWKKDKYIGDKWLAPYEVISSTGVTRSTFTQSEGTRQGVRIKILWNGKENKDLTDFNFGYDSGNEYRSGSIYGLDNVKFPLNVKLRYTTWDKMHTSQIPVSFECVINDPGVWDIIILN
jgi:hypothetical protein